MTTEHADATWETNRQRINGLWPRYQPTDDERRLAVGRLSNLNQRWLAAAIDDYRVECTSTVFRLSELLAVYRRIANTGNAREAAKPQKSPDAERADIVATLERDRARCVERLRIEPRDRVADAVARMRAAKWLPVEPLPAKIEEWQRAHVFIVCAALES
jgi:hypothetical protein